LVNSLSRFQSHIAGCSCVMSTCTLNEYEWMNEWMNEWMKGVVTWRNQCHDPATLQSVRIPSAILKIVFFRHIFVVFYAV